MKILKRVMSFVDIFVLANTSNFSELEQEKNMPAGGIIRQCLRLSKITVSFYHVYFISFILSNDNRCSAVYGMSFSTV